MKPHSPCFPLLAVISSIAFLAAGGGQQITGADVPSLEREVAKAMEDAKTGRSIITEEFIRQHGAARLVPHLSTYVGDSNQRIRGEAERALIGISRLSDDPAIKGAVVDALVSYVDDGSVLWLFDFHPGEFSSYARNHIHKSIKDVWPPAGTSEIGRLKAYILLAGVADMRAELPILAEIVEASRADFDTNSGWRFESPGWSALKAGARMGVKKDIQEVINTIDAIEPEERRCLRFEELTYVRQPEVVQYLAEYLDHIDIPPTDKDVVPLCYGHYAAAALGKMLEGFLHEALYDPDDLPTCRRWVADQKEWHFK